MIPLGIMSQKSYSFPYSDTLIMELDAANYSSGTTWIDSSGNNRNATIYGSPAYSSLNGGYFNLDGSNDYFNIQQVNSQIVTLETALYLEPYPASNTYNFYVVVRQGYSPINFSIYLDNYQYRPYFIGSSSDWPSTGYYFSTGSWKHIVATFNWSNNTYKLYVNGVLQVSSTFNAGSYVFNNTSQGYNTTDISRNVSNNNSFIYGKLALFKIFNSELNQNQVDQNFNFYKQRFGL